MNYNRSKIGFQVACGARSTATWVRRDARGFTLVELMVVVAIAAALAMVAAPRLTGTANSLKLSSATNGILSYLHLARSEAIKRNSRVVLCKSVDGQFCSQGGGWEQGWLVFQDVNNNAVRDAGEIILAAQQPLSPNLRVSGNLSVARYISFTPAGGAKLVGGGFQAGTLTICNSSADAPEARRIVLNAVGRARVERVTLASCG